MPTFILTDAQQVTLAVAGADAAGNPKAVFGIPSWTSNDPATLSVTPAADGFTALAVGVAAQLVGAEPVTVTASAFADAAMTVAISGTLSISVIASPATQLIITPGTPEPKPAA